MSRGVFFQKVHWLKRNDIWLVQHLQSSASGGERVGSKTVWILWWLDLAVEWLEHLDCSKLAKTFSKSSYSASDFDFTEMWGKKHATLKSSCVSANILCPRVTMKALLFWETEECSWTLCLLTSSVGLCWGL